MSDSDPRNELVDHLPALRAFALSLTRNGAVADDMVQDTVVKAWTNIDKFQQGTNMRAWLFTILRNTYYSSRRMLMASTLATWPKSPPTTAACR